MAALLGAAIANNNGPTPSESRAEFERKLNRGFGGAADWMAAQIRERNIFAQWMVQDCAVLSRDPRLEDLLKRAQRLDYQPFYARMLDENQPLPDPSQYFKMDRQNNYERWLFHALSRKQYPLSAEDRAEMFRAGHRTGRATHQLFALIFYRKFNGETPELKALMRKVAEGIAQEASLDFRVTACSCSASRFCSQRVIRIWCGLDGSSGLWIISSRAVDGDFRGMAGIQLHTSSIWMMRKTAMQQLKAC